MRKLICPQPHPLVLVVVGLNWPIIDILKRQVYSFTKIEAKQGNVSSFPVLLYRTCNFTDKRQAGLNGDSKSVILVIYIWSKNVPSVLLSKYLVNESSQSGQKQNN